jgi:hypothetical protein
MASQSFGEGHELRVYEYRVLRIIFGPKGDELTGDCRNCVTKISIIFNIHQILLG